MKSKGLGDTIEKITEATGIKSAVHFLFGDDCGCDERKDKLNKLFPYNVECLNVTEYVYLSEFNWNTETLDPYQQQELLRIYNRVFNQKNPPTSCHSCWVSIVGNLRKLYDEYNQ